MITPSGNGSPIEDFLDDLLRHTRADARTTRRLLDESADHLYGTRDELVAAGRSEVDAEREAVRRFGDAQHLARVWGRRSFVSLVLETVRAAILLGSCGLIAVGLSGGVAAVMNVLFGRSFVGATTVFGTGGTTVTETANDAVALRALAGVVGVVVLAGYAVLRRRLRPMSVLPPGLVDALGAAAFAAGAVALTAASIEQKLHSHGSHGVGFFLSGALVSLVAAVLFCLRATRSLLPAR
jgi:hypothetical protein